MRLSRHARGNMKLYGITIEDVSEALRSPERLESQEGRQVAIKGFGKRFSGYPLKVVFDLSGGEEFIITAYPLKRKAWGGEHEG